MLIYLSVCLFKLFKYITVYLNKINKIVHYCEQYWMESSCVHPCLRISRMKNCVGGSESIQCHQDTDKWFSRACAPSFHPQQTNQAPPPHQLSLSGFLRSANLLDVKQHLTVILCVPGYCLLTSLLMMGFLSTDVFLPVSLFCCLSSDWEAFL